MQRSLVSETPKLINQTILLKGWVNTVRNHGKIVFFDLRDRSSFVQVVATGEIAGSLKPEYVIQLTGLVKARPEKLVNPNIATGSIEIEAQNIEVISISKDSPIPLDTDGSELDEMIKLKYRYLDLKRNHLQQTLKIRSKFIDSLRQQLFSQDFTEIETPMLSKATMEGARDFIVPSRLQPGKFYALPQSPQQYKQLLMVAGFERYFQVARCIRDEDLRADRGFEFTQLDLEMSFVDQADVMDTVESAIKNAVSAVGGHIKEDPFPVISYTEAIEKFGADKFDLRTGEEKQSNTLAFAWVIKFPFFKRVNNQDEAEKRDSKSGWTFTHNPFSQPLSECLPDHLKGENIDSIIATQYDLVCNGYEVGGGSIRAHDPEVLRSTYRIMGYSDEQIEKSIGHMLEAFSFGVPPHGGIALGIDRLVMLLRGDSSLKETIAFPMSSTGKTAVMDAPSIVSDEQLKELAISVNKK